MQIPTLLVPLFAGTCHAQRWKIDQNCGNDVQPLESAFNQARDLATNAYSVLEEHYGTDAHVQQMVKYILGDDANIQGKVGKVKDAFRGVKSYEPEPYAWLLSSETRNTDVVIYCDSSNFVERTREDGVVIRENKPIGAVLDNRAWPTFSACANSELELDGSGEPIPMAITISSDWEDTKGYERAKALWVGSGGNVDPPNRDEYARPRENKPNTINLCKWNIAQQRDANWPNIDVDLITSAQDFTFLQGLQNDNRAINKLSETMGATLLHELTHTNLAGKLIDADPNGHCYGWVCVTRLHDPKNSDSVNMLGVVLKVWSLGFYVDQDGNIQKRT